MSSSRELRRDEFVDNVLQKKMGFLIHLKIRKEIRKRKKRKKKKFKLLSEK